MEYLVILPVLKIMILLLAINSTICSIFKTNGILGCGVFGFCGDPKVMNATMARLVQARIKMLGLYNIERGKHSCGVYMDSQILKGVDNDKLFSDFIQNNQLPNSTKSENYVIIGHTRMATQGTHTYENAHPFIIDNNFVLAHNGVIRNIWSLCGKYEINHSNIHVDSFGLAHLINKVGFKVLNEYEGFAALLMSKKNEPNSLYVYRGVSKRLTDQEEEERPLYYLKALEGIYFSSTERSLLAISDSSDEVIKQLEANVVWKVTNGKFTKVKIPIDRSAVNIGVSANTYGGSATQNYPKPGTTQTMTKSYGTPTYTGGTTSGGQTNCHVGASSQSFEKAIIPSIWHETIPNQRLDKFKNTSCVFFHTGRYWIFTGEEIILAHGKFFINKKGKVLMSTEDVRTRPNENYACYFYEGVMMRNQKCYDSCMKDPDMKNTFLNFALMVSKYSEYPICNTRSDITSRCKGVSTYNKFRWYHNGTVLGNYGFIPKFSDRNYTMKDGLIQSIASQVHRGIEREVCIDVDSMKAERMAVEVKNNMETAKQHSTPPLITATSEDIKKYGGKILSEQEITNVIRDIRAQQKEEEDLTNFYRPWESLEQARSTFTMLEINTIRYYVADIMIAEMSIHPNTIFESNVDTQVNMFLQMCIETKRSVSDQWDERSYQDIIHYMKVAKANPEGRVYELLTTPSEDVCEACEFVPKPADESKSKEGWIAVAKEIPFPNSLSSEEYATADEVIPYEEARVPSDEKTKESEDDEEGGIIVEEIEPDAERDYAFQDIVDSIGQMRDAATELTIHQDDDFAQEVASVIYRNVDPLIYKLRELAQFYGEIDLERYANDNIKTRVEI